MDITVSPVEKVLGTLTVPGDKSISHRALILGAMAGGRSRVSGCAPGDDVASTLRCLRALGVAAELSEGVAEIEGTSWSVAGEAFLDAGNSGTTMRLLAGALAGRPGGAYRLAGDESLSRRPMERVREPLERMGATVRLEGEGGRPPVVVIGARLSGIRHELWVASAQVKGAVLLAALQAEGATTVIEPGPTRDHTERLLGWLGVPVRRAPGEVSLAGVPALPLPAFRLEVPGDFSSAAYWIVAACIVPGAEVTVEGVGLNPTRTGLLDVLASMGAELEVEITSTEPEPMGSVTVRTASLRATEVGGDLVPRSIDELALVALMATQAEGETAIRDAGELRVKESDRLRVLADGLRALGADVADQPDGLVVSGPTPLRGGVVDPGGDHRMALTFAVGGLVAAGGVTVRGWECTRISYPGFESDLERLAR